MAASLDPRGRPGWLLDEVASAGRENLDHDHVARYDGKEDGRAPEEVALLRQLGLRDDAVVVDLGAGTGQFTVAVAAACARVVAVDVSPVMLERLRAKVRAEGLTNVAVVQAGFLGYRHAGEPADFIYSRLALHHLPDAWKAIALSRMRRVLRRGGVLRLWDIVYNFAPQDAEARLEEWCATGGDRIVGAWSRAEFEEHVRDEHSTFTWLLEPMIRRAGFDIEEAHHADDGVSARYILRAA
jgi:ubiquinone/menaquinone biosynthesis C-methylase UbiE